MDKRIHNLGFGMGATWEASEGTLTIYDTSANIPKSVITLSSDQMNELEKYWHDGDCPVCLAKMPTGHVICDDCLKQATIARL